eukprot:7383987-Prymnesium_polylepis.1
MSKAAWYDPIPTCGPISTVSHPLAPPWPCVGALSRTGKRWTATQYRRLLGRFRRFRNIFVRIVRARARAPDNGETGGRGRSSGPL